MDILEVLALVAFLCAAVLAVVLGRAWPVALIAVGLALWLVSTTSLVT